MKTALQIFSWIAIVIGFFAIIGSAGDYYGFIGGSLFLTEGILAVAYINKTKTEKKNKK